MRRLTTPPTPNTPPRTVSPEAIAAAGRRMAALANTRPGGVVNAVDAVAVPDPALTDRSDAMDTVLPPAVKNVGRVPVVQDRGCTWDPNDSGTCTTHRSPLVGVPMPHTTSVETHVRVCVKMLRRAADIARRTAAPTSAMDQLAARMDVLPRRPYEPERGWGTASHYVAALRTLRALPALDTRTVDRLVARAWDAWGAQGVKGDPESLVRALLDALAEEADRA